jgi:hypothetical protein
VGDGERIHDSPSARLVGAIVSGHFVSGVDGGGGIVKWGTLAVERSSIEGNVAAPCPAATYGRP